MHLFDPFLDHDYYFKLLLNKEEQDAQSISRCSAAHHGLVRAVLRANRTLSSAHSPCSGASSRTSEWPAFWPRRLWRSFVPVAWPVKVLVPPLRNTSRCHLGRLHQQEAQHRAALLGDMSESTPFATGVLWGY